MTRHLALLAPLLLTGCAELEPFLPKVHFDRLDLREISWTDIGTDFVFQVENPNPVGVGVAEFSYAFDLQEIELLSGDAANGLELPAEDSAELVLPVDLVFADAFNVVQAARGEDTLDFGLAGEFGFDTPLGIVRVPYDELGQFPALRTPRIWVSTLRVSSVNLTGAELELDLGIDNDLGSTLNFDNFAYGLTFEGFQVGSGVVPTFDVAGAGTGVVTLPFAVNFLTVGQAIATAILDGGPVDVGVTGAVDVGTPFGVLPLTVVESTTLQL